MHDAALKRRRAGFVTSAILGIAYFGFIILVGFAPSIMASPVVGTISLALVLGITEIVFAILLTSLYVWWANKSEADDVNDPGARS